MRHEQSFISPQLFNLLPISFSLNKNLVSTQLHTIKSHPARETMYSSLVHYLASQSVIHYLASQLVINN